MNWDPLINWLADHGVALAGIAIAAYILRRVLRHAIPPTLTRTMLREATPKTEREIRQRAETLGGVLLGTAEILVLIVALLMVVQELGVNVGPVIAGLGIGGIAVGLGAQSLVRDMINGLFILVENQYGQGDMVTVAGVQGWVQEVTLRRTVLRDLDGTVHSIPNSEIKVSSNWTRGFSGVNLLVPLSAGSNVEQAIALVDQVGQHLATDPALADKIEEAPRALRIENITPAGVVLRVTGRAAPGAQWEVAGALRRSLISAFEEAGLRFGPPEAVPPAPAPTTTPPAAPPPAPPAR